MFSTSIQSKSKHLTVVVLELANPRVIASRPRGQRALRCSCNIMRVQLEEESSSSRLSASPKWICIPLSARTDRLRNKAAANKIGRMSCFNPPVYRDMHARVTPCDV